MIDRAFLRTQLQRVNQKSSRREQPVRHNLRRRYMPFFPLHTAHAGHGQSSLRGLGVHKGATMAPAGAKANPHFPYIVLMVVKTRTIKEFGRYFQRR
jgi:hypothetical protein